MKNLLMWVGLAISSAAGLAGEETAPKQEIGLTLGGLFGQQRSSGATRLELGSGVALQANYGYRLFESRRAAIYGEIHFLASPQRGVTSNDSSATRDVASLFLTPGIRVKFFPGGNIAPYVAAGGGWADYEQSTTTLGGSPNGAPRTVNHGAFDYGGGVDFKFWRFAGLRAEIRDFYTGAPAYNIPGFRGGQHHVVAGGGLVLKFR